MTSFSLSFSPSYASQAVSRGATMQQQESESRRKEGERKEAEGKRKRRQTRYPFNSGEKTVKTVLALMGGGKKAPSTPFT